MIAVLLATWIVATVDASPAQAALGQARAMLAAHDLTGAEQAARDALARDPGHGPTLMVLGLVQFHSERYQDALDLFQRAAAGKPAPAPGPLAFNRGSALFALGRPADAEQAFREAARADPQLTGLAEVNAGLAALRAGALDRAHAHAEAAAASPTAAALASELDGLRAQLARAEPAATTTPPDSAEAAYDRGRSLYSAGRYDEAAVALTGALTLGLPEEDAREARACLDRIAGGLRAGGPGLDLRVSVGGGWDSNVEQMAASRTEVVSAEVPEQDGDVFLQATLDTSYGLRLSDRLFLQLGYTLDQIGYQRDDLDPYALQVHDLAARSEMVVARGVRLGLSGGLQIQFSGLRSFSAFQRVATVEPQLAIDEGRLFTTVLRLRWQDKAPYRAEDAYFRGHRLDLRASQRFRLDRLRVDLGYRHRREDIGTRTQDLGALIITRRRTGVMRTFEGTYVAPYSYRSNAALISGSLELSARFAVALEAGVERLQYREDSVWYGTGNGPLMRTRELGRKRRNDDRFTGAAELTFTVNRWLEVALRYDLTVNRSNISFVFDDKNSTKQVLALELAGEL